MKQAVQEKLLNDPFAKLLGMEVEEMKEGYARISMTITDDMLNFHGSANGGVIFSLADAAFAVASNTYGQTAVGINVNINYLLAGFTGQRIVAIAEEDAKNPRLGLYRMTVYNEQDELLAVAEGMVYRKKEYFG